MKESNARLETPGSDLSQPAKEHEVRIVQLEQPSHVAYLEIKGVPFYQKESPEQAMAKLGEAIGQPATPADFEVAHRVPAVKSTTAKNIAVTFVTGTCSMIKLARIALQSAGMYSPNLGSILLSRLANLLPKCLRSPSLYYKAKAGGHKGTVGLRHASLIVSPGTR